MGSESARGLHDGGFDPVPLSAPEAALGVSGGDERVGANADDAMVARAALAGQAWALREIWFRFAPLVCGQISLNFLAASQPRRVMLL